MEAQVSEFILRVTLQETPLDHLSKSGDCFSVRLCALGETRESVSRDIDELFRHLLLNHGNFLVPKLIKNKHSINIH